jgi:UDP-N-acetylglucosamine--N-acetylmuramyl-(pentapeptide) pyrophosphoryl-undecaprenol N-acetylglucosamine transferase
VKLLICAGGTGGGVYPALTVQQVLHDSTANSSAPLQTWWVGGEGGMEAELVKRAGLPFEAIPAAGVHGVGLRALPGNLWRLLRGVRAARRILRRLQPQALLFTGGYVAVPMAVAARLPGLGFRRPRLLLYVPDIEPGLALKTLARFADQVALTDAASLAYFRYHRAATVTGYPVRPALKPWDPAQARQALGLSADLPTLLVVGGSTGARSLNRALLQALPTLLAEVQVVHLSGQRDWAEVEAARAALPPEQAARYRAFAYLHEEMGAAYTVADLVVSRAGASTLGEYPRFGLPAILAPYPYAWRYQRVNADYLARHGAALVLEDDDLPAQLLPQVQALLRDQPRRAQMRQAMQALARPQAAQALAALVLGAQLEG